MLALYLARARCLRFFAWLPIGVRMVSLEERRRERERERERGREGRKRLSAFALRLLTPPPATLGTVADDSEYLSLFDSILDVFVFPKEMLGECYLEADANVRRGALELLLRLCACTLSSERHFSTLVKMLEAPFEEYHATLTNLTKGKRSENADERKQVEEVAEREKRDRDGGLQELRERLESEYQG